MTKPQVTWAGVVVRLSDGRIVALEFDGVQNFITADVHTLNPWNGSRSKIQDEVRITVQGNGRLWVEGDAAARARVVPVAEIEATRLEIEK